MKTALITGVSGQDGSYLAKFLLQKDYKVVGSTRSFRSLNTKNLDFLGVISNLELVELDLNNMSDITDILIKYKPDEIYNLAGQSSVKSSFTHPMDTFTFNTTSVIHLLESIRIVNKNIKLYQASSSEMFGQVNDLPITLDTPMNPISPYAVSKMAAHFMASTYRKAYDLFICSGVLFNHESPIRNEKFFIKKIIKESINIKYGRQQNLLVGNLNVKRDFGYAPKYVESMWMMLQQKHADDFIICSGKSILLQDIVEYVFDKLNLDKNLIIIDKNLYRPTDASDIYGDNTKARVKLNWDYNDSFFNILDLLLLEEENSILQKHSRFDKRNP